MSKPSAAQIVANGRNAKHARGPNTPQGKRRSSHNALRHGLTGRIVVLPTEDMEVYNAFSKELVDSLNPASPMECQFAQTIVDTQWRLNRARSFEDGMLALGDYEEAGNFNADSPALHSALTGAKVFREHSKDFVNLTLYEQRLLRTQKEAFRQFRELRSEREAALDMQPSAAPVPVSPVAQAPAMTAAPAINQIPATTCEGNGFVYANAQASALPAAFTTQPPSPDANGFVYSDNDHEPSYYDPGAFADRGCISESNMPAPRIHTIIPARKVA